MKDLYSFSLSPDHFVGTLRRGSARVGERIHTRGLVAVATATCILALAAIAAEILTDGTFFAPNHVLIPGMAAFAAGCAALAVFARHHGILLLHRRSGFVPGPRQLGIDDDGLWSQGPHGEAFTRWSGLSAIEEYRDMVLVWSDDVHAELIPFDAFESPGQRGEFIALVRGKIAAHRDDARLPPTPARPAPESAALFAAPTASFAPGFRALLNTAVRIAAFKPVAQSQLAVTWVQIVGIVLATLLPPLALALVDAGAAESIAWPRLTAALFPVTVLLIAAIMVGHLIGRSGHVTAIFAGALLAWIVIDSTWLGAWLALRGPLADHGLVGAPLYLVPMAWLGLAVAHLAVSFVPPASARVGWVLLACAFFLALPMGNVYRERGLWPDGHAPATVGEPGQRLAGGHAREAH